MEKSNAEMLAQAERFIESQGFHLMTKEEIPKFARYAAEAYGYNLVVRPEVQGQHLVGKLLGPILEY